ncbi:MAG: trigger factor, partial [Firmicutes bacterium]|nr:trigger factor [Bacillota bacterium]
HARLVPVEDRDEVQEGDLVLIDFTGYIDGKPFEGGQAEGYSLEIGSGSFVPGFEEQLVGAKLNEEKRIEVIYPEKYYKEELAGKEAVFDVKVKEIKKKELPELDDSFVKEVSEFETIEEYRHDIEKKLKEELESRKKAELEIKLIDKISDGSEVEIPEVLVERQLERMLIDMDQYLRLQGLDLEKYLKMSGREISDIKAEQRAEAEKRVKRDLVLEAIMKKEGIEVEVDEQEIEEKIKEIAEHYNGGVEKVREFLIKQGRLEKLREEVRYRKTIDFLVSEATVKEIPAEEESA